MGYHLEDSEMQHWGFWISQLREQHGWTQDMLADRAKISRASVQNTEKIADPYEVGKKVRQGLAAAFGMSYQELMAGHAIGTPEQQPEDVGTVKLLLQIEKLVAQALRQMDPDDIVRRGKEAATHVTPPMTAPETEKSQIDRIRSRVQKRIASQDTPSPSSTLPRPKNKSPSPRHSAEDAA